MKLFECLCVLIVPIQRDINITKQENYFFVYLIFCKVHIRQNLKNIFVSSYPTILKREGLVGR